MSEIVHRRFAVRGDVLAQPDGGVRVVTVVVPSRGDFATAFECAATLEEYYASRYGVVQAA